MRSLRPFFAFLALFLYHDLSARSLEPPRPNEKWTTLRVDEFEIVSNAPPSVTADIARDLLRMRAAVGQVTRLKVRSPLPTKVFVFAGERSFAPYRDTLFQRKSENIRGVFFGGENGNFILLRADGQERVDRVVYHELTHYFVKNTVPGLPLWLNEGIAEYYSTFQTSGDEVHIGRPVAEHVLWLRDEKLIPLRELFAVNRDSSIYNEGSRQGVFYAESWALLHYLMLGSEERRGQLSTFLSSIGAGKPAEEAFSTAFGSTFMELEQELRQYVRRRVFNFTKYSLKDLRVADVAKPQPIDYDELLYQFGHLFTHTDAAHAALAQRFLSQALEVNSSHAGAHADIGRLHQIAGRTADAEAAYQRAVQLGSTDAEIYLLYGTHLINRLVGRSDVPAAEVLRARKLFERSVELDPNSARAWAGIGATYAGASGDLAPGIAALEKSLSLAPSDEEAAFYLVQLYARAGRRADAERLIEGIIASAGDGEMLSRSREALLATDLREMESLANHGKLKEALELAKSILERTTNPALAEHLRSTIAGIESHETARNAAFSLKDAVEKANAGKYAEALAIVDAALPGISDPQLLEHAKKFREDIAERARRKR